MQKAKVMLKCFPIFLFFMVCEKSIFLSDMLYCTLSCIAVALHCMYLTAFEGAGGLDRIQSNGKFC